MVADSRRSSSKVSDMSQGVPLPEAPPGQMYTRWPDMLRHWPKTTLCIVSNEFCERFSYYGMRTVLVLYLLNVLKFSEATSTMFFNGFSVLCYTTPILGSIIADGYIGKFWTIFSVSIIYAIGQVILAVASTKDFSSPIHPWLDMTGLVVIGFGTGGIKPCVSAFGGDQFELGQERMLSLFFSMFYFSINAGSMISTFISPIFRSIPCMGQDSCYPLAFGIPAVLMIVATAVFMAGSFWYKKPPPKENIFGEVARLMTRSVGNKIKAKESKEHWLDHYMTTHRCEDDPRCMQLKAEKGKRKGCHKKPLIDDTKALLRLIIMFLPVPMFWALYDQQGSVWLIQGIQMDCRLTDTLLLLPDQMQTLNAVLILVFIPLFQIIIYPLCSLCIELTPLRKMVAGGLVASLAFVIAGFVQLSVNTTLPNLPAKGEAYISVWNQLYNDPGCSVNATIIQGTWNDTRNIPFNQPLTDDKKTGTTTFHVSGNTNITIGLDYVGACSPQAKALPPNYTFEAHNTNIYYVSINYNGIFDAVAKPDKPTEGTGEFSMGITTSMDEDYEGNLCLCRGDYDPNNETPCDPKRPSDFYYWETAYNFGADDRDSYSPIKGGKRDGGNATIYTFKPVKPGTWTLFYLLSTPKDVRFPTETKYQVNVTYAGFTFTHQEQGGVYVLNMAGPNDKPNCTQWELVQPNSVSILWQVPQIFTITAAEILFSITGYEFAYSQSAPSMKALVQALWLLTTAIGDSIIVLITALNLFSNAATEFFVYAGIMAVVIVIFALLSIFYYDYNYYTSEVKDDIEDDSDDECSHHTRTPPRSITLPEMEKDEIDIRL